LSDLKKLQELAKNVSLLYVEDNEALRFNARKLLKKFFSTLYVAEDGLEGIQLFKEYHPSIVITDIKMPHLDGMEMAQKIKHSRPIFRFLKKPVNVTELTESLLQAITQINEEKKKKIFQAQLGSIFNYQSSMVVMLHHQKPVIANQEFLDYYEVEDIDELNEKFEDLGSRFLEHEGFLYNKGSNWINTVLKDRKKIYNVKMKNTQGEMQHFILKCKDIPDKNNYGILSFDDITELNLLGLYDKNATKEDKKVENKKAIFDLLSVIQRNSAKVSLHNYYKGITIANDAIILEIQDEDIPFPIACNTLKRLSFENQTVGFQELSFAKTSPVTRKYAGDLTIKDISLNAVKLSLNVMPAGFELKTEVILDMVFTLNKKPLIINTKANLLKKQELGNVFEAVFLLDVDTKTRGKIVNYIAKRQMALIREFKGLHNG